MRKPRVRGNLRPDLWAHNGPKSPKIGFLDVFGNICPLIKGEIALK